MAFAVAPKLTFDRPSQLPAGVSASVGSFCRGMGLGSTLRCIAALSATPQSKGGDRSRMFTMLQQQQSQAKSNGLTEPLFRAADPRKAERADHWFDAQLAQARKAPFGIVGDLTPELAEKLLARNPHNRNLSRLSVERMKRDIDHGQWELNGETIIVASDGKLNDGQHRCTAVVESGRTIKTAFWFGAARESRMTVDTGSARTVGHFLSMQGVSNSNNVAACCHWLMQLEDTDDVADTPERRPTKQELLDWWAANRNVEDSVNFVTASKSGKLGGRSVLAAAHWWLVQVDRVSADYFIQRLLNGDGLKETSPIYKLREYLTDQYVKARASHQPHRLTTANKLELIFTAWNCFRSGRRMPRPQVTGRIPKVR